MTKNRIAAAIAMLFMFAMIMPLFAIPTVNAQSTRDTYAYIGATPNPVGVGQEVLLHVGITQQLNLYWMSWEGLTITVTKPDDTTQTLGPFKTDATGGTGTVYVPSVVGNYSLQTHFPEQVTTAEKGSPGTPIGTTLLASESRKLTLIVQADPTPVYRESPLPTEYWSRPIDSQLHGWHKISGNWGMEPRNLYALYNDDAPETAHVLWAKPMAIGGLVGGLSGNDNRAHAFEDGDAYEGKFQYSAILGGILFYNRVTTPERGGLVSQGVIALDLRTGEELWFRNNTMIHFGQVFYWDSFNYHGAMAYLWEHESQSRSQTSGGTYHIYEAFNGEWVYTMTDVPSGTNIIGPAGEILRYTVNTRNGWMTLWNSTKVVNPQQYLTSWDGSWARNMGRDGFNRVYPAERGIQWNVTIPTDLPGSAFLYKPDDRVVGISTTTTEVVTWAINLKPGQVGQLLFKTTWGAPSDWLAGNQSISRAAGSIDDGAIAIWSKETQQYWGFSTENGQYMWGPTEPQNYLDFLGLRTFIADGKVFSQGMSGILHCYDADDGRLLWTYSADDPNNQVLWANDWSIRPVFITDGKIYMGTSEHSPVDPKPRGGPFVCVDIETGNEIFRVDGMFRQNDWGGRAIIGDSIIATMDSYDQQIYAIGKGPSSTSVLIRNDVLTLGSDVLIQGMVTDISAGTMDYDLAARFPHGVPAVADASMSDWMLYVYKHFERPADIVGVPVTIDVIDSNGNYRNIGEVTSDENGMYSLMWTPDIQGKYTVIAKFAGSKAYFGSFAETVFGVMEAPEGAPVPTQAPASLADQYMLPGIGIIVAAIAIVGVALALLLKKR